MLRQIKFQLMNLLQPYTENSSNNGLWFRSEPTNQYSVEEVTEGFMADP